MSVAISQVFANALAGKSKERQGLVDEPLPLQATLSVVSCAGGEALLRGLFEPLGYAVQATGYPLDPAFPAWGQSDCYTVTLAATCPLCDLLRHLSFLIPVLDNHKHHWAGDDEVEKLLRHGEGWLAP